jgi:hypothetical protein
VTEGSFGVRGRWGSHALYTGQCPCPPPGSRKARAHLTVRTCFPQAFWLACTAFAAQCGKGGAPRGLSGMPVRRLSLHPATLLRHARARSKRLPPLLPPHSYPAYGLLIIQNAGWCWTWGLRGMSPPHLPLPRTYIPSVVARFAPCVSGGVHGLCHPLPRHLSSPYLHGWCHECAGFGQLCACERARVWLCWRPWCAGRSVVVSSNG